MGQIGQRDFSAGYCPNDDFVNGRPNSLQRMDNLNQDQSGALTLARGPQLVHGFNALNPPLTGFSKMLNNVVHRYIMLTDGSVVKDVNKAGSFPTTVITARTPWSSWPAAFGSGFGQIFIYSGSPGVFKKDDGTTIRNWGILPPGAPPGVVVNSGVVTWYSTNVITFNSGSGHAFTAVEGTALANTATSSQITSDGTTFRAIFQVIQNLNLNVFSDTSLATDADTFNIPIKVFDSAKLVSITVEFLLETPTGSQADVTDFYWKTWAANDPNVYYRGGLGNWGFVQCKRSDFQRVGITATLDWSTVKAIRIFFNCTASGNCSIAAPIQFVGGANFPLYAGVGDVPTPYQYIQVNVNSNLKYLGKSIAQFPSGLFTVVNGSVTLTPYVVGLEAQTNMFYFYKKGGTLDQYYFVGSCGVGGTVLDNQPDSYYLEQNLILNVFLDTVSNITDIVTQIEGPVNGRFALLSPTNVYFTDYLNPEVYDTRLTLTPGGNTGEINLFLVRINNSQLLLGTTQDIYEITGTFAQLADGTFDFSIHSLGIKQPPICSSIAVANNMLFYIANDGVRMMFGMLTEIISTELQNLWRGLNCNGVPGFYIVGGNLMPMRLVVSRNKLYLLAYHIIPNNLGYNIANASIFEMDIAKRTWARRIQNPAYPLPANFFVEEDGTLMSMHANGYLQIYDAIADESQIAGETSPIFMETPALDGGEANTRKDLFTLRLHMATGGQPVDISLENEFGSEAALGTYSSPGAEISEVSIPVHGCSVDLSKRFSLNIVDHLPNGIFVGLGFFRLVDWSLDYRSRPTPQLYLREYPNNLGSDSRKRIYRIAFMLDTLGSVVNVTPSIDGVAFPTQEFQSSGKTSFTYAFQTEVVGIDLGLEFKSVDGISTFEYYGVALEECITEKMPPLADYQVITPNNFGIPSKKRIRTLPFQINTRGNDVTFTPYIDGMIALSPPQTYNTTRKQTVYYYFINDAFGTDFGGILSTVPSQDPIGTPDDASGYFEFYGFLQPSSVEQLPVPKVFDQIGPVQFDRVGRLLEFRARMISEVPVIQFFIWMDDVMVYTSTFTTQIDIDTVYSIKLPKTLVGSVCRIELLSTDPSKAFFRWHLQLRVILSGMGTEAKWIPG